MSKIRVLLADDHETVRQGLRLLIDEQPDMEVIDEVGDGHTAIDHSRMLSPDVAVIDVSMPKGNGLVAARGIRTVSPRTAIVALTRYDDEAYVNELLAVGATGYVLKQSASSELLRAIRSAARGERHLDPRLGHRGSAWPPGGSAEPAGPKVTRRETQVLRLMALGYSNKDIAQDLDISVKTVEVHKTNAMRKLGLAGRIDVIKYASLQGWLDEP